MTSDAASRGRAKLADAVAARSGGPSTPRWLNGVFLGVVGMLAFSGTLPATRVAVPAFGPMIITLGRIEIAAALGALTLLVMGQWRLPDRRHWAGILWMGAGLAVGYPFFVALALQDVPSAHGAVVIGLAPAVTALIAVARAGERPPLRFWIACTVGVGAVLVFAVHQGGSAVSAADGWLLLAMASVGVAYVEGGRVSRELGGTVTLCWAMIALAPLAIVPLGLALWWHEWSSEPIPAAAWVGLWYAGVVSMFLGSVAWYRGLAAGGIARIGQLNLVQPLFALLWSALLLGEQITTVAVVCAVVIVAAMSICLRSRIPVGPMSLKGQRAPIYD
jgi:drug/metabolite transporter (DMT)-like permease